MPSTFARTLRVISCKHCQGRFYICSSCYRGQRYCSELCRTPARRQQKREANRRYRQSREARLDHCDRQREYRRRKKSVLDQSSNGGSRDGMIGPPVPRAAVTATPDGKTGEWLHPTVREVARQAIRGELRCAGCGYRGEFIDISTS